MNQDEFNKKLLARLSAEGYKARPLPDGKISIEHATVGDKSQAGQAVRQRPARGFDFVFSAPKAVSITNIDNEAMESFVMAIRERLSEEGKTAALQVKMLPNGTIVIDRARS